MSTKILICIVTYVVSVNTYKVKVINSGYNDSGIIISKRVYFEKDTIKMIIN